MIAAGASPGAVAALGRLAAARPGALAWAAIALHVAAWTLYAAVTFNNPGFDPLEGLAYGPAWQLGYWKHPPLPWWELAALRPVAGTALWPYALLAELHVAVALWAAWRLGVDVLGPVRGLAAMLPLEGIRFFGQSATELNHDVVSLPLWALAGWLAWRALRDGRTRDWVLLGAVLGVAVYAKYILALLVLVIAAFMVADPWARRAWRSRGPWLAAAVALAIALPHLAWLWLHDFLPFVYAEGRSTAAATLYARLRYPLGFLVSQVLSVLPAAVVLAPLIWRAARRARTADDAPARRYVATIAVAPCLVMVAAAIAAGRSLNSGWGFPLWPFVGVCVLALWPPVLDVRRLGLAVLLWLALLVGLAAGGAAWQAQRGVLAGRPGMEAFDGAALAAAVEARWRAAAGTPLAYVVGTQVPATAVGFFAADRPAVVGVADPRFLPWIDAADLRRRGAAVVWEDALGATPPLHALVPEARAVGPATRVEIPWRGPGRRGSDAFRIAIVPPAP